MARIIIGAAPPGNIYFASGNISLDGPNRRWPSCSDKPSEAPVKIETKFISPAMAEKILATNNINRPVAFTRVIALATEMNLGKWQTNGETIIISENGKLLDGQHRLFAIIEHGKPVEMTMVTGAPNNAFETIDTGRARTGFDIAGMNGVANPKAAVGGAALLFRIWHQADKSSIAPLLLLRVIERYPSIRKWSGHVSVAKGKLLPAPVFLAALVYLEEIAKKPALAEHFYEGMTTGVELARGSPVLALRNRMITQRGTGARFGVTAVWNAVARVLNALEDGLTIQKLALSVASATPAQPAYWKQYLADLEPSYSLDDLHTAVRRTRGFRRAFMEEVEDIRSRANDKGAAA